VFHRETRGVISSPVSHRSRPRLSSAIVTYCLTLGAVFVLALIIDALAPHFGSTSNQMQSLTVSAYFSTAS